MSEETTARSAMKLALEALELVNLEFVCANGSHHAKEDRHEWDEDCPITDRWRKAITALREALASEAIEQPRAEGTLAQQEPVALKWQQAPIRTAWGDDMVVASVAIDKDHTVCLYCERDQTPKVDAMFAQRTWVGLDDKDYRELHLEMGPTYFYQDYGRAIEAKLRSKNEDRN